MMQLTLTWWMFGVALWVTGTKIGARPVGEICTWLGAGVAILASLVRLLVHAGLVSG